jgi:pimeloyl-ACP methyl ester carboxylesterase
MRRVVTRALAVLLSGVVVVVLLGVLSAAFLRSRPVTLPAPTGAHGVGVTRVHFEDATRPDPGSGRAPRPIEVTAYYPATGTAPPAPYMSAPVARARMDDGFIAMGLPPAARGVVGLLLSDPAVVTSHAMAGAPAGRDTSTGVLIFMPGLGMGTEEYATILEDLASQGRVVLAVAPAGNTATLAASGRLMPSVPAVSSPSADPMAEPTAFYRFGEAVVADWSADALAVYEQVASGRGPALPVAAPARFVALGHSLGGSAALEACRRSPDCAGAVDIDGGIRGPVGSEGLGKPVLILRGEPGLSWPACEELCQRDAAARALIVGRAGADGEERLLAGFGHLDFSDHTVLYDPLRRRVGALGDVDGAGAVASTRAALNGFVGRYLPSR